MVLIFIAGLDASKLISVLGYRIKSLRNDVAILEFAPETQPTKVKVVGTFHVPFTRNLHQESSPGIIVNSLQRTARRSVPATLAGFVPRGNEKSGMNDSVHPALMNF